MHYCCLILFALLCDFSVFTVTAAKQPNIVLFLTDDQDIFLGGWTPMKKATKLLSEQGATATNWMIHTPVCCPSRAELLSGRYFHNIVSNDGSGCMHVNDSVDFESHTLGRYLNDAGYKVGLFGKYLNSFPSPRHPGRISETTVAADGTVAEATHKKRRFPPEDYIPPGYERWFANNGGTYYKCAFTNQHKQYNCDTSEYSGYSTSVIGNTSIQWIQEKLENSEPFMAYIAPKAPHIEDTGCGNKCPQGTVYGAQPSPWYKGVYNGTKAPITPSYDFHATDHHQLVSSQPALTKYQMNMIDSLYESRWEALLSVDDLIQSVVATIAKHGELENTYFLSTSDHGYTFGQLRQPMGKWEVYDNDIRIPMVIRGPGIKKNSTFDFLASNVDVAPTILSMAGITKPERMDGKSVLPMLINPEAESDESLPSSVRKYLNDNKEQKAVPWRKYHLVEYFSLGNVRRLQHWVDDYSNTYRALRVMDPKYGDLLYAEYSHANQTVYTPNMYDKPGFFEMYNLTSDPWQMKNIYRAANPKLKKELRAMLEREWSCKGQSCA